MLCATDGVFGQSLGYESFTGMTLGTGVTGSGTNATGWADSGWSGGSDVRFQTVDPTPDLSYQVSGGLLLNGGDRALQLSTAPEPVPTVMQAYRTIPAQNATLYFSFLIRLVSVGTGSDTIELRIGSEATTFGAFRFQTIQNGQSMFVVPYIPGVTYSGTVPTLGPGQTYLFVAQFARFSATSIGLQSWINPPATQPGGIFLTGSIASTAAVSRVGFNIASTDTGGPSTTVVVDEFRVGYIWADVVPPGPPPQLVPEVQLTQAARLQWQTQSGKTYRVQVSYDLSTWNDIGSPVPGDGTLKTYFDSTDQDAKKFYRVQIQ